MPKRILLSNTGAHVLVDEEDYDELSQWKWYENFHGYAARDAPMEKGERKGTILMHRQILNAKKGDIVDHENRDKKDNRRTNISIVPRSQNNINVALRKDNKSGYKGVSWRKTMGDWRVQCSHNGKIRTIDGFECRHEAARAYNELARELHGERAYQNIIEEDTK